MKFRYKVLITNLILLSVSLGLVGYLMIHKNFELAKETQISNAVIQNNLVQSSVEYEVLQALNREESVKGTLPDIGAQVSSGMRAENVTFFIYYGDKLFYPQIGVKPCSMAGGGVSKNIWNCFRTAPEGTGQPLTCSTSGMGLRLK